MGTTKKVARRLTVEKQGLTSATGTASKVDVYDVIDGLGCIQIDTISVVERAHHLTLWSRLGPHDKGLLDELAYGDRSLFEYWAHAACYLPMEDYRFFISPMRMREEEMLERLESWGGRAGGVSPRLLDEVLARVRAEGPLAAKDFEHRRKGPSKGWWDWKPAKVALEVLYGAGILMVSHRESFQRMYDIAERVLPPGVDTTEPTEGERVKHYIARTMASLGLVKPADVRGYYTPHYARYKAYSKRLPALMEEMSEDGEAMRLEVEWDRQHHYCLPEDADRLDDLADGPGHGGVYLLNPFDNALWDKKRVETLFGFTAKLEAYTPAPQRKYGYYYLAILYGDRLVGRVIPKLDRKDRRLIVNSTWHEPWFKSEEPFENGLYEALDSFAEFNGADEVEFMEERPRIG
ncbi:winged helix-turn-helix domain-containing protein [Candidatus Bathyarchaeota archaeon]|nr:winged helix-turn-helix domain-containing protein [Candidatus Bathyarchaeota archaeon]